MMPTPIRASAAFRGTLAAVLWLGLISCLHACLNSGRPGTQKVLMGYMPVVTNLSAPIADQVTRGREPHFEAVKFASFAEMAEAFRSGHIQVAFIIAPMAIALFQQGIHLKVVYIGNRHESTLVVGKDLKCRSLDDLAGKTVAVPIRFSGHLLALRRYFERQGLDPESVRTVEVPPPDMPSALATGAIDGYFVGEPFASKALQSGMGKRLLDVESIWPGFICNLMIVREELVDSHPDWVQTLVTACVRAGLWARTHEEEAARLAAAYWGQDPEVARYTFSHPPGRFRFDLFRPELKELEEISGEMLKAGFIQEQKDLHGMMEDRFARAVDVTPPGSFDDILRP